MPPASKPGSDDPTCANWFALQQGVDVKICGPCQNFGKDVLCQGQAKRLPVPARHVHAFPSRVYQFLGDARGL
jgi:hypothetical protein